MGNEYDIPQHNKRISNNISNPKPHRRPLRIRHDILQHHDRDPTRQASGHSSKAHKEHDPRFPSDAIPAIAEVVGAEARLVDAVDDEHAQRGEDAGDPVDEVHVEFAAVERGVGEGCCVDEGEEGDGELCVLRVSRIWSCGA